MLRIVINDREITNPFTRFFIIFSAMVVIGLITAGIVFIILPLLGVTVVITVTFVLAIVAASVIGAFIFLIITFIYSVIKGSLHVHVDKHRR